jgi:glycosyltransferase involved in cell wall biosynthesis
MMKVLHIISGLQKAAGTSVFCVELCDHIKLLGVEASIAVSAYSESDGMLPKQDVPILRMSRISDSFAEPDIIHVHGLWSGFPHQACAYARKQIIPLVVSPHGMLTPWALNNSKWKKRLAWSLYQKRDLTSASLLHATADSEVVDIRQMGLKQSIVVAPLGVNISLERLTVRRNNPKIALFVSRVHPQKGLFNLIDAWSRVKPHGWKMVIAGPDQDGHTAEVLDRASALGIAEDIEMRGAVFGVEKDDLYAQADLFVLPSHSENFGVVVIEALAQGCPVITTKGTPWTELATNHCGWWIDVGVEPLANALWKAMSLTDEERQLMGEKGRKLVKDRYAWPTIADQMKQAYEWVLNGGDTPSCVKRA